jgi:group I intron endonuclease
MEEIEYIDEDNHRSGIYAIFNDINGKLYIGSAVDLRVRMRRHIWQLKNGSHHNYHLQKAVTKYGINSFIFCVIEYCEPEKLIERENYWFTQFDFKSQLYNSCPTAGSALGIKRSEETCRKLSKANKGRTFSEEFRKQNSERNKGKIIPEETRRKISEANKGKMFSEEHRRKLSEAAKQRKYSEDYCKKISERNKGFKHSEESRKKMSESKKNMSGETRKKISEATCKKLSKPVYQLNRNSGEVLATFNSIKEASQILGLKSSSNISEVCTGKRTQAHGYRWQYASQN